MSAKLHIGFKHRLLGMLFLFFNCVCTAAPVIKATSEDYKQAVSVRLAQSYNEEESRLTACDVVLLTHFSFKKQHPNRLYNAGNNSAAGLLSHLHGHQPPIDAAHLLPIPGYYSFLFRYKLF